MQIDSRQVRPAQADDDSSINQKPVTPRGMTHARMHRNSERSAENSGLLNFRSEPLRSSFEATKNNNKSVQFFCFVSLSRIVRPWHVAEGENLQTKQSHTRQSCPVEPVALFPYGTCHFALPIDWAAGGLLFVFVCFHIVNKVSHWDLL